MRSFKSIREQISQGELNQIERFADRLFAKVGIDVEFTRHFIDRVNDARNKKDITPAELTRLFKQTYNKHGKENTTTWSRCRSSFKRYAN